MSSPNFAKMSKQGLVDLRRTARNARERPSAANNYFTTKFNTEHPNQQPADWVSTELLQTWCEYHGPTNHTTADCHAAVIRRENKEKQAAFETEAQERRRGEKRLMDKLLKEGRECRRKKRAARKAAKLKKDANKGNDKRDDKQ